jgi:hypothetical protein
MKTTALTMTAVAVLAAGCGGQAAHQTRQPHGSQAARLMSVASDAGTARCAVSQLSVRLGRAGHAAGSTYQPIVFTNKSSAACTLTGYPGVSYVAPKTGAQVGAAASRDAANTPHPVSLAAGGHAASLLQLANPSNYPAASCTAKSVSGLRVYPPGSKAAAYIAFAHTRKACSSDVQQLTVRAVLKGRSGQ